MLQITSAQWDVLSSECRRRFEQRMVGHMRMRARGQPDDDALVQRTRRLIDHALEHGIAREIDVRRFLELLFDGVDDVVLQAEISRILGATGIDSASRVSMLAEAVEAACTRARP